MAGMCAGGGGGGVGEGGGGVGEGGGGGGWVEVGWGGAGVGGWVGTVNVENALNGELSELWQKVIKRVHVVCQVCGRDGREKNRNTGFREEMHAKESRMHYAPSLATPEHTRATRASGSSLASWIARISQNAQCSFATERSNRVLRGMLTERD